MRSRGHRGTAPVADAMIRALGTALLCAAAVLAVDTVFRVSVLGYIRPAVLSPPDQGVLEPPVIVRWEGPPTMRVRLAATGEAPRDLGLRESPFELGTDLFQREGGYLLELEAPGFGGWVGAMRRFQVHAAKAEPEEEPPAPVEPAREGTDLMRALNVARTARDRAHQRAKLLTEENSALREESARLAKQLETVYASQEHTAGDVAEVERRLAQVQEEARVLGEENAALRLRLSSVLPCSVWGYYGYSRSATSPRRILVVSDLQGQVFRFQAPCESMRRADATATSVCFCVGTPWGG